MGGERPGVGPVATAGLLVIMLVAMLPGPVGRAQAGTTEAVAVDLSLEIVTPPQPVSPGTVVAYEAVIRNGGTGVAEGIVVRFEIPAASVSLEGAPETCAAVGAAGTGPPSRIGRQSWALRCDLGTLAPGREIRLALAVSNGSPGTHLALGRVTSACADANPIDNSVITPLLVLPDAAGFTSAFQQPGPLNPRGRTRA